MVALFLGVSLMLGVIIPLALTPFVPELLTEKGIKVDYFSIPLLYIGMLFVSILFFINTITFFNKNFFNFC